MYELYYNGLLKGLFTSEESAKQYAENNSLGTYSIYPPNTMTNQPEYAS